MDFAGFGLKFAKQRAIKTGGQNLKYYYQKIRLKLEIFLKISLEVPI